MFYFFSWLINFTREISSVIDISSSRISLKFKLICRWYFRITKSTFRMSEILLELWLRFSHFYRLRSRLRPMQNQLWSALPGVLSTCRRESDKLSEFINSEISFILILNFAGDGLENVQGIHFSYRYCQPGFNKQFTMFGLKKQKWKKFSKSIFRKYIQSVSFIILTIYLHLKGDKKLIEWCIFNIGNFELYIFQKYIRFLWFRRSFHCTGNLVSF